MKLFIFFLILNIPCFGQTQKIVYGAKDTTYYSTIHYKIDGEPQIKYKLKEPLPNGKWLIYNLNDTTRLIEEINYKNKKKNGYSFGYNYYQHINGSTPLFSKTEILYKDDCKINWNFTSYDSGVKSYTSYGSMLSKKKACMQKKQGYDFPRRERADSTISYWRNGKISSKGYFNKCSNAEGVLKKWNEDGSLFKNEFYKDGILYKEEVFEFGKLIFTKKY